MLKVIRVGQKGINIMLGKSASDGKWFKLNAAAAGYAAKIGVKAGDMVGYTLDEAVQGDTPVIVKIFKEGEHKGSSYIAHSYTSSKPVPSQNSARDELIMRQTVLKAVATTVSGLEGVDINNVVDITSSLFVHYLDLAKGNSSENIDTPQEETRGDEPE